MGTSVLLSDMVIGADDTGTCDCKMDDVRVYNRQLSQSEVTQLYKSGAVTVGHSNAIISDGLVGYWT